MQALDTSKPPKKAGRRLMKRAIVLLTAVAVFAVLVLATPGGWPRSEPVAAASGGPEMRMEIIAGSGGFCNGNDCYAQAGATFTLGVDVVTAPAIGYSAIQTFIFHGDYDPTASEDGAGPNTCSDGFNNGGTEGADRLDPDCASAVLVYQPRPSAADDFMTNEFEVMIREDSFAGTFIHGGITGLPPSQPVSTFEGRLLELDMGCPATPVTTTIELLLHGDPTALTSGTLFVEPDLVTPVIPKVNSITVNCVSPQPFPGDTDGDGCADAREEGSNPALGGDRDFLNPWDFYDVAGLAGPVPDGVIDLLFDILGVIEHEGTAPGPPYDVNYDRGAWLGANSWNDTLPPDGVIDEPIDIDGVFAQYGHNCT